MDMQMQPIRASFPTQEQAEAAMHKLASLRGDGFRLENIGEGAAQAGMYRDPSLQAQNYTFLHWGDLMDAASSQPVGPFTLSANVPAVAAEQARRVIVGAGGQLM